MICTISWAFRVALGVPPDSFSSALLGRKAARLRITNPLRFSVYLKSQDLSEVAAHSASRVLALRVVASGLARRVGQNAIQLFRDSWREVKDSFRRRTEEEITVLLPPLDHYLPYNYPLPYALLRQYGA